MEPSSPAVFISYASLDLDRVRPVYEYLVANGVDAWIDVERLRPGQRWEFEIRRAMSAARLIIVFMSLQSRDRTGYVQRELKAALDKLQNSPLHKTTLIPVLLDPEMPIPDEVAELHCERWTEGADGRLLTAIRDALGEQAFAREAAQQAADIEWSFGELKEEWEGLPGYKVQIAWPEYRSGSFPLVRHASDAIRAEMQMALAAERAVKLHQAPDAFSFGECVELRTNLFSVTFQEPVVRNRVLTQFARLHWYGAGAAHGMHGDQAWVFILDPLVRVESLPSIFENAEAALRDLLPALRQRLFDEWQQLHPVDSAEERADRVASIAAGTRTWDDLQCFGFVSDGLALSFPPYQIGPYSLGAITAVVPDAEFHRHLRKPIKDALGLKWFGDGEEAWPPWEIG